MKIVGKKNIYLLILLVICLLGITITPSYAKFASGFTTDEDVAAINFSFDLNISNIEEYEEIVVDAKSYQVFNVEITNNTGNTAYYGIWYKMVNPLEITDDIIISKLEDTETTTSGIINNSESKTVTIIIKNITTENIKVNIGINTSMTSTNDIEYLGGKKLISGTINEVDFYYDDSTSKYISIIDDNVQFTKTTTNYSYTGSSQTFTSDHQGFYKLEAWGAQGGDINSYTGGRGAYTSGIVELNKNDNLYIYVGGAGSNSTTGGYNGGAGLTPAVEVNFGSSGGGATDFRLISGTWDDNISLYSRIMVAGGGGGANDRNGGDTAYKYGSGNGGAGGTLTGVSGASIDYQTSGSIATYNHHCIGTGGTQTQGGSKICYDANGTIISSNIHGGFGNGNSIIGASTQSGAGSGYYGGGISSHGGAGGGSSYISGHKGAVSAGKKQYFKVVYSKENLKLYDIYENMILNWNNEIKVKNVERTSNYIGKSNWSADSYFKGQIYKLKITLKDGTVVLNYDFTKNTVNDSSGNGYHGILKNGASLKRIGKEYALFLDGVDDYLQIPTLPSTIDFNSGFIVEFEVIWDGLNNYSRIIDLGNGEETDNFLIATTGTTDKIYFSIWDDESSHDETYSNSVIKVNGTNFGKDNEVCETGDSDITCSYHYSGKVFYNSKMIAGNASMPTHDGTSTMTGNSGNGYAKITTVVPEISIISNAIELGSDLEYSCIDNGTGCKLIRTVPSDITSLSSGSYDVSFMVMDDFGYVYKYNKTIQVGS